MGYKFGQRRRRSVRENMVWTIAFITAFALGGVLSMLLLLRINKAYGLTGPKQPVQVVSLVGRPETPVVPAPIKRSPEKASTPASSPASAKAVAGTATNETVRLSECSPSGTYRPGLSTSSVPQLRKLVEYEQLCSGSVSGSSFFTTVPITDADAISGASWIAGVLKEFSRAGIKPLIFLEPVSSGDNIDLLKLGGGSYDSALNAYFSTLKAQGVTDAMMGTWVPLPEGNIPVWDSTDPAIFSSSVTKIGQAQKKYFPASNLAVMLESKSYPSASSWSGGSFKSLVPYVQGIPKGLVDSFGLQGFAWPPTSPGDTAILDPASFLRVDLAAEAARKLGVGEVWFNTGTFAKSYVVSRSSPYTLSAAQRQTILNGILNQAQKLKAQGFAMAVHLFNEDKSETDEGIDWSYWSGTNPSGQSADVLKTFVHDLQASNIDFWVYDN